MSDNEEHFDAQDEIERKHAEEKRIVQEQLDATRTLLKQRDKQIDAHRSAIGQLEHGMHGLVAVLLMTEDAPAKLPAALQVLGATVLMQQAQIKQLGEKLQAAELKLATSVKPAGES